MEGVNQEIRNRIRLSVAAYAYEYKDDPVMSDASFDVHYFSDESLLWRMDASCCIFGLVL